MQLDGDIVIKHDAEDEFNDVIRSTRRGHGRARTSIISNTDAVNYANNINGNGDAIRPVIPHINSEIHQKTSATAALTCAVCCVMQRVFNLEWTKVKKAIAILPDRECIRCFDPEDPQRCPCSVAYGRMHCANTAPFDNEEAAIVRWVLLGFPCKNVALSEVDI